MRLFRWDAPVDFALTRIVHYLDNKRAMARETRQRGSVRSSLG